MIEIFIRIFNMSITGTMVILAVLLLRFFLKPAPRVFSYVLWLVVFARLLLPISFKTDWGILPDVRLMEWEAGADTGTERFDSGENQAGNPLQANPEKANQGEKGEGYTTKADTEGKQSPETEWMRKEGTPFLYAGKGIWLWASVVWLAGCAGLLLYEGVHYGKWALKLSKCRENCRTVTPVTYDRLTEGKEETCMGTHTGSDTESGEIFHDGRLTLVVSKEIEDPFTAGWIKPVIYLPWDLTKEQQKMVIVHEKIHILRLDHLIKPLAWLALCIHWFNPFVWLAFYLMEQDMEISCDEAVLRRIGYENKKAYAHTLLLFPQESNRKLGCPVAFGERNVKNRIKNVVRQKAVKPWVIAVASIVIALAAVLLLVDGNRNPQAPVEEKSAVRTEEIEEDIQTEEREGLSEGAAFGDGVREGQDLTDDATEHTYYPATSDSYGVLLRQGTESEQTQRYHCPVELISIANDYGYRTNPVTQEKILHSGIDFAAEKGTPVNAAADGRVFETGWDADCGNYVILEHKNGEMTYYANCDEILVEDGREVADGAQIATVGNTGKSTGAHLHFALSREGRYIEPIFHDELAGVE